MKNTLLWILKLGLSAALIWFLLGSVDVDEVMARVARMDITNVMSHIESYEEEIEKGDLNIDTI